MPPKPTAPYSSQRHELLEVIQSLTQQLQKADEAVVTLKTQVKAQVTAFEEEIASLQTKLTDRNKTIDELRLQLKETEHQLSHSRQAQTNAEREAQQYQNTLALSDRIHASSLEQSRREAQEWKEQFSRTEATRLSQTDQIQDLLKALQSFMVHSQANMMSTTSQMPIKPAKQTFTPNNTTVRYVGPLVSVPLPDLSTSTPRVKQEEDHGVYAHQSSRKRGNDIEAQPVLKKPNGKQTFQSETSASMSPDIDDAEDEEVRPSGSKRQRDRAQFSRTGEMIEEDDDDEMAIGYEERHSTRMRGSPGETSGTPFHSRTYNPDRGVDHDKTELSPHRSRQRPLHGHGQTPNRTTARRPEASNTKSSASAKKRKLVPSDGDDPRGRGKR